MREPVSPSLHDMQPYLKLLRGPLLRALLPGLLLACLALFTAVGLLSLSGWFITMSALVGVLGITSFSYLFPSGGVRTFALLRTLARYSERVVTHQATFLWLTRLRVMFFDKALRLPTRVLAQYRSADLLSRVTSDIDALDQVVLRVLIPTISTGVIVIGCLVFIAFQSVVLALLTAIMVALVGIGLPILTAKLGQRPGTQFVEARASLKTQCIEALQGRREIASYRAEAIVRDQLGQYVTRADHSQRAMRHISAFSQALTDGIATTTMLLALVVGLSLVLAKILPGPNVAMICLLLIGMFEGLEVLPHAYQFLGHIGKAAQRLNALFLSDECVPSPLQHASFPSNQALRIQNVFFRYGERQKEVLRALTVTIPPASFVAITGRTGSGKSTLLKLIAREIELNGGSIYLGEIPLEDIEPDAFLRHLVLVSQDSHIFNATIRQNLLLAKADATDEEMRDVLEVVCLAGLVKGLVDGIETEVGEHGYALSGGERRRLSIARALLRRPEILLLDEPTAGVDRKTAEQMLVSMCSFLPESMIVVATHDTMLLPFCEQHINLSCPPLQSGQITKCV